MSVLLYAELVSGRFKKPTLEAAGYAAEIARRQNLSLAAVVIGNADKSEIERLGRYGIPIVYQCTDEKLARFVDAAYTTAVTTVAESVGATFIILPQTNYCKALAPRLAIRLKAAYLPGLSTVPTIDGGVLQAQRVAYTNKAIETISSKAGKYVIVLRSNTFGLKEQPVTVTVQPFAYTPRANDFQVTLGELNQTTGKILITDADVVVAAGRGLKGPENWPMIEQLADLLGAATACSKPVSDVHWRPHHEHVGQTGIQISPNVYIAIGISGAIQHLAGVSASKTIIAINTDKEAPIFKAADYGIVGDAFEVVPKLITAIQKQKQN
jgi:electron transfer flavoprotein alpha subunit